MSKLAKLVEQIEELEKRDKAPWPVGDRKSVGQACRDFVIGNAAIKQALEAAEKLRIALDEVSGVMWMAEKYAEGGGSRGPEMSDFLSAQATMQAALAASAEMEKGK